MTGKQQADEAKKLLDAKREQLKASLISALEKKVPKEASKTTEKKEGGEGEQGSSANISWSKVI